MAFEFSTMYDGLKNAIANKLLGKEELEKQFDEPESGKESDKFPGIDGAVGDKVRSQISAANLTANSLTFQIQQFIYATVKQMIEDEVITGVEWDLD